MRMSRILVTREIAMRKGVCEDWLNYLSENYQYMSIENFNFYLKGFHESLKCLQYYERLLEKGCVTE